MSFLRRNICYKVPQLAHRGHYFRLRSSVSLLIMVYFCQQTGIKYLLGPLLRGRGTKTNENPDLVLKELSFSRS